MERFDAIRKCQFPGGKNRIAVDGRAVAPQEKIYLILNKPRGIAATTASDEEGRGTIYSLLSRGPSTASGISESALPWVAPVGRLDKASEGLLLLTNDSEWGARIADPQTHLPKTYHVQIGIIADDEVLIQSLVRGVRVNHGEMLQAKYARRLRVGEKNCWLEIVLDEGRNRQIRRMMDAMNVEGVAVGARRHWTAFGWVICRRVNPVYSPWTKENARPQHEGKDLMNRLSFLPAAVMAGEIRKKKISPVELVDAHLTQIEKLNPRLNAFVQLDAKRARRAAQDAETAVMHEQELGSLHGVPISIKSSINVAGLRCESGSRLRAGYVAGYDAPLVARLRAAGANCGAGCNERA